MKKLSTLLIVCCLTVVFCETAHAVQIKRIQRGIANFDTDDVAQEALLANTVDQTKSIIVLKGIGDTTSSNDQNWHFTADFADADSISIDRGGGTSPASCEWQVIEFDSGVTVQRGISVMNSSNKTKTITITSVDTAKAVPFIMTRGAYNSANRTDELASLKPTFASATSLQLDRSDSGSGKVVSIVWQVVEFTSDASVQTGTIKLDGNSAATPQSNTAAVNSVAAPLLVTYFNGETTGDTALNGQDTRIFTACSYANATVTCTRRDSPGGTGTQDIQARFYLVDLADGHALTQTNTQTWAAGGTTRTINGIVTSGTNYGRMRVTTSVNHGYADGDYIFIGGDVTAASLAMGGWKILTGASCNDTAGACGAANFELVGSTYVANATAGTVMQMTKMADLGSDIDTSRTWVWSSTRANSGTSTTTTYADDLSIAMFLDDSNSVWSLRGSRSTAIGSVTEYGVTEFAPVTLTVPNGGESWAVGSLQTISWKSAASVAAHDWKLQYSTGPTTINIVSSTNATPISVQATAHGLTTGDTVVIAGHVTNTNANGTWRVTVTDANNFTLNNSVGNGVGGATGTVTYYAYSDMGSVCGGDGASACTGTDLSTNTATYKVQDYISTQFRVRLVDTTGTQAGPEPEYRRRDDSNADLSVKRSITLTSPNGGEEWVVNSSHEITWDYTGSTNWGTVALKYSTDGGGTFPNTIATGEALGGAGSDTPPFSGKGTYTWTVPDSIDTDIRVEVSSETDTAIKDSSDANFSIIRSITLTAPTAASLVAQTAWNITWTYKGETNWGTVKLQYSTDAPHAVWTDIATGVSIGTGGPANGSGSYSATNIPAIASSTLKVRVISESDAAVSSTSADDSTVVAKITVDQPSGGTFYVDQNDANSKIMWTLSSALASGFVKITYSTNNGSSYPNVISASTQSDNTDATHGFKTWTIPDDVRTTAVVKVKVEDTANASVYGESPSAFKILGQIDGLTPGGGEVYNYGASVGISWTMHGTYASDKFNIYLSSNGGTTYPTLLQQTLTAPAGNNSWNWPTGTQAAATNYRIKVTLDSDEGNVFVTSSSNFRLKPVLDLTAPNGGEVWSIGSVQNITWSKTGSSDSVDLTYSTNSGGAYGNSIASAYAGASPYPWTLPDAALSTTLRVKAALNGDATVYDTSANDFKGKGALAITVPSAGGVVWEVGTTQNITWTSTPLAQGNVKLFYSTDGGSTYPDPANLITTQASSDQSYTWTIPDAIGTNVKVKIVGVNDATVSDESDNAFKIKAKFVLSRPNGGESFLVGANEAINWSTAGTVSAVNLYRSSNSGGAWTSITTALSNTNTYSWGSSGGVADSIGTTNRIKVEDASDSTASDSSNADYTILGSLDVTAPDGAETLVVGGSKLITWTAAGTLGNVKIFYSTDGGSTYPDPANLIATVPASNLNYNWTPIPDAIGANVKIKIVEQSAPQKAVDNASGAAFAIKGSITLTAPNNGENFFVGQHHNITWTKTGTIGNIKLVYSTDSGATYPEPDNVIASGVDSAAGTYDWTVADAIVTTARVKAYQESDSSVGDTSNNDFNIKGSLTLTSFTGGQSVEVGSNQSITWTRNGNSMGPIKIEYSTDGGTSYPNTITASVASAALSQAWTIPDAIGTQVRVKLTLLADAATSSASSSNFEIKGKLTVTAPNGNETWLVGTPHNITWTTAGTIPNVNIHYSTDSGATYPTKIAGPIPNSSPYNWTIPDAIGVAARVRVSNVDDANVKDESNSDFTIKGILGMTYPDGGEVWVVGSSQIITWTRTGSLGNVSLKYSTDGGSSYPTTIATVPASDLTYDWTIPDDISATARVKITETSNPIKADAVESAANFAIKGSFTITSPNGGQVWAVGSSHAITWTKTGTLANAKILFSSDGGSNYVEPDDVIIASVAASDLTYTWTLPDTATTTARVKIVSLNDALVNDASNANFTIQGSLTLTAPTGGQTWVVGESKQITWTHTGTLGNCTITYGTDSGVSYPNTLTANVSGSADSYNWTIPDNISNTVRVKIEQNSNPAVKSESSSDLSIKGGFTVTAPNGSESWLVGSSHNITWTTAGTVANVKLFYSADSGTNWTAITGSIANSSPYSWTIPDAIGSALRVKVENAADSSVKDISNADFAVKGVLALTSPAGTETWIVGSQHLITWTKTGSLGNVDIDYSTDGGSTYPNSIAAGVPASDLNFNWTIPDSISATARVKVTEVSVPAKADAVESAADFAIKGSLTITSPNGSEVWLVGSSHNVTWTKTGTLGNIKLVYSTDAGTNYTEPDNVISAGVAASDGTFPWTVPDTVGTQIRVKATLLADTGVNDASNANFIIRGSLTLTSMTGGQAVVVGDSQAITWTYTGTIGNIKIDYSTNSGSSYPNSITASVAATALSQAWTIPNDISDTVRVRLTQLSDAQVVSASATDLAIKGGLTITAPNGNETLLVGSSSNITWTTAGTVPNIKLYYSTDGGGTFPNAITGSIANSSPYSWTIPDAIDTDIRVKIENAADATVADSSNANFAIKGALTLTAPTGGQTWIVGGSQLITWTKTGSLGDVKIFYSTDGGSTFPDPGNLIATVPASDLNYSWTIPDSISDTVRVQLVEASSPAKAASSASGSDLAIKGSLTITAPNGNDVLKVGDTQTVTWTKTGTLGNIKLLYSTDSGATYPEPGNVITASVAAADGTFDWTVPDDASEEVLVKAVLLSDTGVNDASNSVLAIRPSVTLTSPNTNVSWNVGSAHNITWTKTGTVATVKLEYTTDGGNNYTLITGSVAGGALSYGWTVPDAVSDTIKVKITSNDDASVTDSSDVNFAVKPTVTLTAPNGGEAWVVNSAYDITWTKVGTIVNVKLTYSTDGGSTYPNTIINSTNAADLTYEWTIPDDIDNQVKVKVAKVGDEANVFDESDANFKIKGALQVTSPNGTESWGINTHHNITWNTTGTVGTMKIEYSTDAGSTFPNVITASVDSALGTYDWLIPDDPTSQGKVKITSTLDSTVTDASNSNFSMVGTLFLASPDGGEAWIVGSSHNITWTKFGSIATVKLEYSTDGGTTYPNSIATNVAAAGLSYTWTIPDAIDTDIRVKITDEGNASVNDVSAANFTIKGSVTVTSPNGSETWKVGESRNITWTKTGTIGNVKIDYSTNGGGAYPNAIVASVPGDDLSYAWTVADAIGIQLRVKVTTLADSSVNDASNNDFTVRGQLTVTAPNGAETWIVGATENITWSRVGSIANAKLEYSTDGGTTFPNEIIASTGAAAGTYAWTIPDSISGQVRVRVSDASDAAVKDDSDANLAIKGSLTITAPNGGQSWVVGSVHAITWTKTGTFANVKLEYSTDGGSNYPNEITASTSATAGTYDWTIPDSIGSTVKVKVTNLSDGAVADASNTNFSIIGSLTLTAPNGSELWYVGDSNNITWTKVGSIANVKLEYSKNSGSTYPNQITASTPAGALSYSWTIPDQIGQALRVRISDATDANVVDTSDANFTIAPLLTLTAPNGGEVWVVNDSQDITWTKTGSEGFVKLEYSTDGGSTFPNSISASTANTGTYSWTVPDQISTTVSVRLTAVSNAAAFDTSDINFKIRGSLTLTSPNGNESWDVAAHNNVTWTKVGSIALVKLEYSTNGGGAYPNLIAAGLTASDGSYDWTIPDAISTTLRVKVTDSSDGSVFDTSNANFTIKGAFTLTAPNGGEGWVVGTGHNITWTRSGSIASADLAYSTNGGSSYPNAIVAGTDAATGTYSWTIPDAIGSSVRVKITDAGNANVTDASNANFTIQGAFTLNSPNGGEVWIVGSAHNITWSRVGSILNAKLDYSTDSGATFPNSIIGVTDATTGTYSWSVPDAIGGALRVRITDTTNANVLDDSNGDFTVKGSLEVSAPNGGEVWTVGSAQNITWNRSGTITAVKLEYSTNGGSTFPNSITASTSGTAGTYAWTIPDAIGTSLRVRVTDASDASVTDDSDANFTVKGSIVVTSPNGSEAWVVNSSHAVTWTKTGTFANVKVEYSTDSGSTYPNTISASTDAAAGTFTWSIPDDIQSSVRVKVTNLTDNTVNDASDTNLKIVGSFTLTAPNGSELWQVGSNQNVTWTKIGSIQNAKIEYSTNSGSSYPNTIVASTSAAALSYTWVVPDVLNTTARVRVSDAADSSVNDTSDANFQIVAGFHITAPDGGEVWTVASAQDITWTKVGSATNVKLQYSTDGGSTFPATISASTSNSGTYAWTVPDAIGSTLKVRVSDASNANAYDDSDLNFRVRGALTLTAPNGNEVWNVSTSNDITWTRTGSIANVKLEYSIDDGATYPNLINGNVDASLLTYAWTIPDDLTANARVKVTDASDGTVTDSSNAKFRIAGTLTVTAPNGSETWLVGSAYNITWTKVGSIATVKLEYSTDGGASYPNEIIPSVQATDLSYSWTIPDAISTQVRVKITDTSFAGSNDITNANFKIAGVLTITSPNGGEVWDVASVHAITWTRQGSISNVKLDYSTNGGSTYPNSITNSTSAAAASFNWTVPDSIGSQLRIKITNLSDNTVYDTSDADFKLAGVLTLSAPDGGEVWSVGATEAISWTRVGSISAVDLKYSTDGGVNYSTAIVSNQDATTLGYTWTIPDAISSTVRVKILDHSDATVFDVSNANFKIRGAFTLTSPNGSEGWVIGTTHNVTWTKTGTIANAKLEYSKDSGATYTGTIVGSTPAANLSYAWSIPDDVGTQVRVRVSQVGDSTVFDASDANFTIRGGFTVTSPVGGEAWAVGSTHDITWTTGGTIPNVKLQLSTNGGASYTSTIIASTTNTNSYTWSIPDALTLQARVSVQDVNDAQAIDASPANFKIQGTFTITSPNGGDALQVGASKSITWTKTGSIANAKLEYSTNSGSTYPNLIIASTSASALSYNWTVPDAISTTLRIKITDVADSTVTDTSDGDFSIKGTFTVTAPNGSEAWTVASTQNITWGTLGTVANVKLEYSTDAGSTYTVVTASTANAGTYAWTVPDAITTQLRVRVSDTTDSSAFDVSDANAKIKGSLTMTSPNGGEKWNVGTARLITWDRVGSIPNVKLEYSSNNGAVYVPIIASTGNTGAYSWTIPDAIGTQALVRVTDTGDNTVIDASNAVFKIMGNFTMTSPNGGEVWSIASAQNLTWTSSGTMTFAKLEYSTDGGSNYNLIVGSTDNNGLYAWTVPDAVSGTAKIKVSDPNDADAYDESNANFRMRVVLVITAPNGGQKWTVGRASNITWNSTGTIPNVKLMYSNDGFVGDSHIITAATANNGSYSWTLPDAIANTVRVRISDPNDIGAIDDSNADFKIMGGFVVTSPNGTEKWDVDSIHSITWTHTGSVTDAKIEVSTNGGAAYSAVAQTTNTDSYDWAVPDTISASCRIRISDPLDSDAFDISDANFKIRAKFTVSAPNGGEIWTVNDANNIVWATVGTVANVKLDYSTDSGATYPNSIILTTANAGTYSWTVPDSISTLVRVRVMSVTDVDAFDTSNADFKIRGKFVVSAPNGAEQWKIAQSNNITWATTGTIPNVKLYYSTNSGSTYPNVITASVANANTYAWTIPDAPTTNARVRVENVTDSTVYDDSNANFSIQGFFTLTAPNGGEQWEVAQVHNITWNWGGTIANVKLTYSTDSGATYPHVISASSANGAGSSGSHSYSWTVPDDISPTVRVKVEDLNDAAVFDASDADLKIIAKFVLTAPNGGERWVTNETRNITWTTAGTVPNVKLIYSHDNFATNTVITASTNNANTYAWTVPDPGLANVPKASKVRVLDVNDQAVYDSSDASFNIDYYSTTWDVRDLLTNAGLSGLTNLTFKSTDNQVIIWSEAGISANPPRVQPMPYGTWVSTWSKSGYGDVSVTVVADQDRLFTTANGNPVLMETSTVHIWLADSRITYDPNTKILDAPAWLSRDGSVVTGAVDVTMKIYEGSSVIATLSDNQVDASGFFHLSFDNSGDLLVPGKTYTTITDISNAAGGHFKSPGSFEITTPSKLQEVLDTVNTVLDKPMSQVSAELNATLAAQTNTLTTTLDAQTVTINTKLDSQTATINTKLDQQTAIIQATLTSFENTIQSAINDLNTAAQSSLTSAEVLRDTALKFSWQATVSPNPAQYGEKVTIQAQGPANLKVMLQVYNDANEEIVNEELRDTPEQPGVYIYQIESTRLTKIPGKSYSGVVSEETTGGLASFSGSTTGTTLDAVLGVASQASEASKNAKDAVAAIKELQASMATGGDVRGALRNLQAAVNNLPAEVAKISGGQTKGIRTVVNDIQERLTRLAGNEGLDLSQIVGGAIEENATIQTMSQQTEKIQVATKMVQSVVESKLGHDQQIIVADFIESSG